jgi:sporulation protein YlmC with PRC-barrel domain
MTIMDRSRRGEFEIKSEGTMTRTAKTGIVLMCVALISTVGVGESFADNDRDLRGAFKASNIIGKDVENTKGEDLGDIKELVVNPENGEIAYAVITYGGFLGLGDKYFAVPWSALNISQDREHVVLNVDQKKLENAPGFDKDNWPNLYDPDYALVIYRFYEVPFHGGAMKAGGKSKSGQPMTIKGEVLKTEGEFYVVKEKSGREVRMHVDHDTKMDGKIKQGDTVEAQITQATHAQSIRRRIED